jgi:aminomethyltransferase
MAIGTPFHPRTAPLNAKARWREWAGYLAATNYAPQHDIEYHAIRNAAALIDVSPLFKARVSGPDAARLVDRVVTRDAGRLAPGRVIYTPWCDEAGAVIDDGTVGRLDDGAFRWTAAEPLVRWLRLHERGLDVVVEDTSEREAALAIQGPLARDVLEAAAQASFADLRPFGRRTARVGPVEVDVSRTGYTGDLGYELWVDASHAVPLWDALTEAGAPWALRPAGLLALDVCRIEAGLVLAEVDYTSARRAHSPGQRSSPYEVGLGRFVDLDKPVRFTGRDALRRERRRDEALATGSPVSRASGPLPRRLVGLELDWDDLERAYARAGLSPHLPAEAWREQVPVHGGGRQVGRTTSGTWSPLLKRNLALASVEAGLDVPGTPLQVEWTVEGHRERIAAVVARLPFLDLARRRV